MYLLFVILHYHLFCQVNQYRGKKRIAVCLKTLIYCGTAANVFENSLKKIRNWSTYRIFSVVMNDINNNNKTVSTDPPNLKFFLPFIIYLSNVLCFGLLSNSIILLCYPFKRNIMNSQIFIKLLAIMDIFTLSFSCPFVTLQELGYIKSNILCKIGIFLNTYFLSFSVATVLFIAVERWFCICRPHTLLTKNHMLLMTGVIILISSSIGIFNIFLCGIHVNQRTDGRFVKNCVLTMEDLIAKMFGYAVGFIYILFLIIIFILYSMIYKNILTKLRESKKIMKNKEKLREFNIFLKQVRIACMLFGITAIFLCSWTPFLISRFSSKTKNLILLYAFFTNNSTNFVIYLIFDKMFRKRLYLLLCFFNKTKIHSI